MFTIGPIAIPRLIAFVKSVRRSHASATAIWTLNRKQSFALNVLFLFAIINLLASFIPWLKSENIFELTESRLQIPTNVLFTRLSNHRPLTERDEALRAKFVSLDSRLLYAMLGPDVLADCSFCSSNDGSSRTAYISYALPALLAPHLLHLAILGFVSSAPLLGRQQSTIWRNHTTIIGIALAAVDVWLLSSYDPTRNARASRLSDVDFFYWKMRVLRMLCFASVDAIIGFGIWLTATGRWRLEGDVNLPERIERIITTTASIDSKLTAVGALRNAVFRTPGLRDQNLSYYMNEEAIMGDVYEDRDVVDAVNSALGRIDVNAITQQAAQYSESILSPWDCNDTGAAKNTPTET